MLKTGQQAPEFTLQAVDGSEKKLSDILAAGPAVVCFFKITCPVCQYTFPFLERLSAAAHGQLRFFGVSQDSKPLTDRFLRDYGIGFPALLDTSTEGYPVSNAYRIRAVPSLFLVEPDGIISLTMDGFEKAALEEIGRRVGAAPFRAGEAVPAFRPG